jgi:hypothetical protein
LEDLVKTIRSIPLLLVFAALASGGAACGSDSSGGGGAGGSGGSGAAGGSGGSGAAGVECHATPELAIGGVWAASIRMTVSLSAIAGGVITICPEDQKAEASMLMVFEYQQNPSDATDLGAIASHVCAISLPEVTAMVGSCDPASPNLVKTQLVIPDALASYLPQISVPVVKGTLSGTQPGSTLTPERVVFLAGSTRGDAELPHWKTEDIDCGYVELGHTSVCDEQCVTDCASLTDDDGDGFPGVTLAVCGRTTDDEQQGIPCSTDDPSQAGVTVQGRAWLDLQIDPLMTGIAQSSCEISGKVEANLLYNLVGADVYLVNARIGVSTAISALPEFSVVGDESPYRMLRVDGQHGAPDWGVDFSNGPAACAALLEHEAELL